MRVTRIHPDRRAPSCLVIELDGARFASVPPEVVRDMGLEAEQEVAQETVDRLSYIADVEASYRVATRMLAARPRSVHEVLRKLRERGHNPSAAAEAVGRLESRGLLDDTTFAEHYARVRSAKGHGPPRLLTDLMAKGVDRRLAERAIDRVLEAEGVDPMAQARQIAEKRRNQLGDLSREKLMRRLVAYLGRRGFRGRDVVEMVREVVGEER
ncbi:MAG: recombination regulator RecX [Gemmatimonadota bacterium]|nr:recombination regulator RecX [Gemmatimonadota bacterium]